MKNKKMSLFAIILIASLIMGACQPAADATEGAGTSSEIVTIVVWDFGGSEMAWMDNVVIPEFQSKNPNIKVEHVGILEDELGLKLETAIAAGEPPDLVLFPPARVIAAGHILPLDDFMARDGISRDDYGPLFQSWNVFTGGKIDNKVVSLPMGSNLWALMYNKDLFAEAGLPELGPDDYIDFETWLEYARAINKPSDNLEERVWGSLMFHPVFNAGNNYMSSPFILGDDGRTCEGIANNADWLRAWEVLNTAYAEDITPASAGAMLEQGQEYEMFMLGKVGMAYGTLGNALYARSQGVNVAITGQPVVTPDWKGNAGGWNDSYGILAATKHPEEAWAFLKYLSTEAMLKIPFGTVSEGSIYGLPAYLPLHKQGQFAEAIANDPLVAQAHQVMTHVVPPPFTVDVWTSLDVFNNIFTKVAEEGMTVQQAVNEATSTCQQVTDQLWEDFDAIGK